MAVVIIIIDLVVVSNEREISVAPEISILHRNHKFTRPEADHPVVLVVLTDQPAAGNAAERGILERKHFPAGLDIYEAELTVLREREDILAVVNAVLIVIDKRNANLTAVVDYSCVDTAVRILLVDEKL